VVTDRENGGKVNGSRIDLGFTSELYPGSRRSRKGLALTRKMAEPTFSQALGASDTTFCFCASKYNTRPSRYDCTLIPMVTIAL
jgi:hypothetical protein